MSKLLALLILMAAALLEAGGDALVRYGLHSPSPIAKSVFIALGAITLLGYGVAVNVPPWTFGRLLGVYVALFFLVAQLIAWFGFGQRPTLPILVGGALIVAGGTLMTVWSRP